jgi:hypothetical protein
MVSKWNYLIYRVNSGYRLYGLAMTTSWLHTYKEKTMSQSKSRNMVRRAIMSLVVIASVALASASAMAAGKLIVQDSSTTPVDKFVVTDQGFVGIGLGTNVVPPNAVLAKGLSYPTTQIISHYVGVDPNGAGGFIAKKNNVSTVNGGLPIAGDRIGYMLFGSVGTDGLDKNAAGFGAYAETVWTNASFPSYFAIETAAPSSARSEKMRVGGNGNVGIGSKSPNAKLEVNGGVRIYPVTANGNTETPTNAVIPVCDATTRGTLWFTPSATTDVVEICVKIGGNYAFKAITLAP